MRAVACLLGILTGVFLAATLVLWAVAMWLQGADIMRLFGTGFVILLAAGVCAVGALVAWIRSDK